METIEELERLSPILLPSKFVYDFFETKNIKYVFIIIAYILNNMLNKFLKEDVARKIMKDKTYSIIGRGLRPKDAKKCGIISSDKKSKEHYGMPSGHAQSFGFFLIFELLNSKNMNYKIILSILIMYLAYTRIKFKCHTYQQVIVGLTIGGIVAYVVNKVYNMAIKKSNN